MTVYLSTCSKIGKVMRIIGEKEETPFLEKFRFRERAKALFERWRRLPTAEADDYAKGSNFKGPSDMDLDSPVLHDILRVRRECIRSVGGLGEVIVKNAFGRAS